MDVLGIIAAVAVGMVLMGSFVLALLLTKMFRAEKERRSHVD